MKQITFLFLCLLMISTVSIAQENPKIDKETLISSSSENAESIEKLFRSAERYYRKGSDYYGEALKYYIRLYEYAPDLSPLNYKIGICCLYSSNPKRALEYLVRSYPDVASDYHLHLGRAHQFNLQYDKALESYNTYYNSLSKLKKFSFESQFAQLRKECTFGKQAAQDTLPVFVKNLGPVINTYYDEYAAVLSTNGDSAIFFTSRRPKREPKKIKPRTKFKERVLVSNNCLSQPSSEATEPLKIGGSDDSKLKSTKNLSVSGIVDQKNKLFYYKGKKNNGDIYSAEIIGNRINKPKRLRGKVNHIAYQETSIAIEGDKSEYFVDIETEGKAKKGIWQTTYFVSNKRGGEGGKDIWKCVWKKKLKFKNIENLGSEINTPHDEEAVYVTPDGQTLYFASNGHQGMGGFDIFKCEKQDNGAWGKPENLGYPINSPANELFYHPTSDTMIALLSTTRDGGFGGLDIYKVEKDPRIPFELYGQVIDNQDSSIIPAMVSVFDLKNNDDIIASTEQDTLTGIYSINFEDCGLYLAQIEAPGYKAVTDTINCPTTRHARVEANYQLEKLKFPFTLYGNVIDLKTGVPIQAEVVLRSETDSTIYYRTVSNKHTGLYSITIEDKSTLLLEVSAIDYFPYQEILELKENPKDNDQKNIALKPSKVMYHLTGNIFEEETHDVVEGKVSFTRPGEDAPFAVSKLDSVSKKYTISVEELGPFIIQVDAEGYFFLNAIHEFTRDSILEVRDFTLKPMKSGAKIVIENILFNSGKSTLKPESYPELNKLATLLLENTKVKIEVSGHTDNVGSASINKKISKARALTVRNYLLSRGVEGERVTYEGYGFDQPIADNTTKEGRAQNRRVEIKVIE